MPVIVTKKFTFEAAHHLPGFPEGHKCKRLHGHSFQVEVNVSGEINPVSGILIDFGDIKKVVKPFVDSLDHHYLNELGAVWKDELMMNPTSENLCKWFYTKLKPVLPGIQSVAVAETCTTRCLYSE